MILRKGDAGPAVLELQRRLLALGHELPRWGADGDLGEETFDALNEFLAGHLDVDGVERDRVVSAAELALVDAVYEARQAAPARPAGYEDHTRAHPMPKPKACAYRGWMRVEGVGLHQTACVLGEAAARWYGVAVHFGITRKGRILHLNPIDWNVPHGNGLNGRTIGIEIDGHFAGVKGDLKTYWRPKEDPTRQPLALTAEQRAAARDLIRWLVAEVASHGGKLRRIHAHRQASADRRSDPGSEIWQEVALPMMAELGLNDGGPGWVTGGGFPIPAAWDISRGDRY